MKGIQKIFFWVFVKPLIAIILGINVRNKVRLPKQGPAIIIANHNSHLDTLVIMHLFSSSLLYKVRPVAAADYFLKNRVVAWFSLHILRIIPIKRKPDKSDRKKGLFLSLSEALSRGEVLIFFPEGTRGEPEVFGKCKSGIAHIAKKHPNIPIYPLYMYGLGKSLPKNDPIFVPFFCDVYVGQPFYFKGDKNEFMKIVEDSLSQLQLEGDFKLWE